MENSVIINKEKLQTIVCVLENEKIVEKYVFSNSDETLLGSIYACKVVDIVDGMQAAFVDIGKVKKAFISLKDAMPKIDETVEKYIEDRKISEVLAKGQMILAQVKKEPIKEKGAKISTHITLPGKYIVLMPNTDIITVSQKIESEEEKERLKEIARQVVLPGYGLIVRTDAENIPEEKLREDIQATIKLWESIENKYNSLKDVSKIYSCFDMCDFVIRDIIGKNTKKVYTNDLKTYKEILKKSQVSVEMYENEDIIEKFGLLTEYSKIEDKKVWLKCGGQIIIDKTEALTAIDVNSGKFTGKEALEATVFKVNVEAAIEIMKQLRLKDIGGIIIVDFIDMKNQNHREAILEILKKEAKKDRSKVIVYEFTKLNLVEITRKKVHA